MCHHDESHICTSVSMELSTHYSHPLNLDISRLIACDVIDRKSCYRSRVINWQTKIPSVFNWPSPERECASFWWLWQFLRWHTLHRRVVRRKFDRVLWEKFHSPAHLPDGPVKISDNNIENIFNININIQGVFSNNIEQDIVTVIAGLVNQQGLASIDGSTLKDKLMALAKNSDSKDVDINIPVDSSASVLDFNGLGEKIKEAISKRRTDSKSSSDSTFTEKAKELLQDFTAENPQLKLWMIEQQRFRFHRRLS